MYSLLKTLKTMITNNQDSFTNESMDMTTSSMNLSDVSSSNLTITQIQSQDDPNIWDICVSIHPESDVNKRGPAHICCVIDVSGSMGASASVDKAEDSGLSVLDVVKHAVNTIIQVLNSHDHLSIVTFSTNAKVVLDNVQMNDAGKAEATQVVDSLYQDASTNLWAGLLEGMKLLTDSTSSENTSLFILTDGVPNMEPSGGHINAMKCFKEENGGHYPGSIHTFGFGYSLKSALLNDIATEGNGTYSFIPDAGFVGTVFVNTLANQLTAFGTQASISLQLVNEEETTLLEKSLSANGSFMATSWGVTFNVGNILFGQKRDFVVQVRVPDSNLRVDSATPLIEAVLKYKPLFIPGRESEIISIDQTILDVSDYGVLNLEAQKLRVTLIEDLKRGYDIQDTATVPEVMLSTKMKSLIDRTTDSSGDVPATSAKYLVDFVSGLLEDLNGQIRLAHSQQSYFNKWGFHYLPSLRCAHQRQQCNNFKDPGVQNYGGTLFQKIRDLADEIFLSLPAPKPSRCMGSLWSTSSYSPPAVNMSTFHNAAAGCFEGSGQVALANGKTKLIRDVSKGDRVLCENGTTTAEIECVVRTECSLSLAAELVELPNGLLLTPWHPVMVDGKWQFPMDIVGKSQMLKVDCVFNFVLGKESGSTDEAPARGKSLMVNGIKCITLAHGIENDLVATHDFYGTDKVLRALQKYDGYDEGLVKMDECDVQRHDDTGLVCDFRHDK